MNETKWTKGPWILATSSGGARYVYQQFTSAQSVQPIKPNVKLNKHGVTAEMEANAHLIAAAPEMYEALKAIVIANRNGTDAREAFWEMAESALKKARGEQ